MPARVRNGTADRKRDGQNVAVVHQQLRDAILHGELEPGAAIPQGTLASQFHAGRTPLREALRLLQREGLVVAEPNRPVRVASISIDDFVELYIMRLALETVAIRLTVPELTSDDLAELEASMAKMDHYQEIGDQAGLRRPHDAFHRRLVAAAGERVTGVMMELADHSERYRLAFGGTGRWQDRRAEHRAILDAAKRGDADEAANQLANHYAHTAGLVFAGLEPDHDVEKLRQAFRAVAPGVESALSVASRSRS